MKPCHKQVSLSQRYIIIDKIGSGSFGEVYMAEVSNTNGKYVAAKVEDRKKSIISRIINEYKIYKYIRKHGVSYGIPKVYDLYQTPDYNIMFMQLLGPNLEQIFINSDRKFTVPTVLMLGIQIINLLKNLHDVHYLHRDIKPSNFLIGRGKDKDQIFIMDFGLSRKYVRKGKHIKYRNGRSLIGTARYASHNMHKGIEPSRRDELESVGYMLIYFLKGMLPWQGLRKVKDKKHITVIGEKKLSVPLSYLCSNIPECFKDYITYCRSLQFYETPNYNHMCRIFCEYCKENNIIPRYEWRLN